MYFSVDNVGVPCLLSIYSHGARVLEDNKQTRNILDDNHEMPLRHQHITGFIVRRSFRSFVIMITEAVRGSLQRKRRFEVGLVSTSTYQVPKVVPSLPLRGPLHSASPKASPELNV